MYKSVTLDNIRQKIDALDNQVHDLLLERADLIMAISEEKKKQGMQIVQPAREARMLRRLLSRHRGPLPGETIIRIWRELVSSVSLLQTGLSVAVFDPVDHREYWDMARDYFGNVLPMNRCSSPEEAFNKLRNNQVTFAILPYDNENSRQIFWRDFFASAEKGEGLAVIQRLPFCDKMHYDYADHPALVIAKAGFGPSDDDHTLIGVHAIENTNVEKISEYLKEAGFVNFEILSLKEGCFVVDVVGYVDAQNNSYIQLQNNQELKILLLGGYPSLLMSRI